MLQESWETFKKVKTGSSTDMEMLVIGRKVEKTGEHAIKIFLNSALEVSILDKLEQDIVRHFRKELKNSMIHIEKEVQEQEPSKKLYTSKDKFDYMAQQNPSLKDFKDRLGLDFEY